MNAHGTEGQTVAARVLVVDDEPSIVDAVATALRYEGFDVDEATNGRDAISAVAANEPDLVVLDWMLPDIEGIEVGRRIRDRGFKTAILFLTAKEEVESKAEALRAGGLTGPAGFLGTSPAVQTKGSHDSQQQFPECRSADCCRSRDHRGRVGA